MHYKKRELANARRRLEQQLLRMGWAKHECPYPQTEEVSFVNGYNTPHINQTTFWFENCLKRLNQGSEAYYALEMRSFDLVHITWRCNYNNPNNHHPLDTLDAFDYVHEHLINGLPYDYRHGNPKHRGIIRIIDWEHPENNTFEYVKGWRGALNDGFAWDFILCVNAIPLGGILLEANPTVSDEATEVVPCQAALDLAQYQLDKDFQFPVYCHALVISDGEKILAGDPWMDLEDMQEIRTLKEVLRPTDFLLKQVKSW